MVTKSSGIIIKGFLVVNAAGEVRTVRKTPRLRFDEVAFAFEVKIPTTWGKVQAAKIHLDMPEPPEATVRVTEEILHEAEEGE
jgi:hypothetical protein